MALSRSQWLAVTGGAALIAAPFLPLVDTGGHVVSLLGRSAGMPGFGDGAPAGETLTKLRIFGVAAVLYAAAVVLVSVWWSTARHFLYPSIAGLLVSLFAAVLVTMKSSLPSGWVLFIIGHLIVLAASLIDRNNYAALVAPDEQRDTIDPNDITTAV